MFKQPHIIRVYYDIETFDLEKQGVPEHSSRTAFISMIGMLVVHPSGVTTKICLLNRMLDYNFLQTSSDISVHDFPSEAQMC
jgi:hypothetical protein